MKCLLLLISGNKTAAAWNKEWLGYTVTTLRTRTIQKESV